MDMNMLGQKLLENRLLCEMSNADKQGLDYEAAVDGARRQYHRITKKGAQIASGPPSR